MSLAILFHFLCTQHVSDINISIIRNCCAVELPHWSYCSWFDVCWRFGVDGLEWCPCRRLKHCWYICCERTYVFMADRSRTWSSETGTVCTSMLTTNFLGKIQTPNSGSGSKWRIWVPSEAIQTDHILSSLFSTLKMEEIISSETLIFIYMTVGVTAHSIMTFCVSFLYSLNNHT